MAKKRERSSIQLLGDEQKFETGRRKLPRFEPHDFRSLIEEAKTDEKLDSDHAFLRAFRRRNEVQIDTLLKCLGLNPSDPDAWKKGFFLLGMYHHGVARIAWSSKRTNRNAATWSCKDDLTLFKEVMAAKSSGLSERKAVRKIAKDRAKREIFPYRSQTYRADRKSTPMSENLGEKSASMIEQERREARLWAHWHHVKSFLSGTSLEDVFGIPADNLSPLEKLLHRLDQNHSIKGLRLGLVKNQVPGR
jgi:hypothetical protein